MLRTVFAISVLVGGCVLPQHRGVATVSNGWLFGGGLVFGAMASSDASNPNSWKDLDHAVEELAVGLIFLGAIGEVLTLALHHDDPPANPSGNDVRPTWGVGSGRTPAVAAER